MSQTEENKALFRRYIDEAWGKGNVDVMDELMVADYVAHPYGAVGRDFMKGDVAGYRAAFPDLQIAVDVMVAEDDLVVARATMRGTHRGQFMGIAPTGREVTLTMIGVDRVKDGKIVEGWGEMNLLGLMQQLGAIPAPQQATG